jgi:3-oxoacyl-[acyl-carrier-protein] synthase II
MSTSHLDHAGRPVVAVTGLGLRHAARLRRGDNWAALLEGRSGIRRITRFPTEHLKTEPSPARWTCRARRRAATSPPPSAWAAWRAWRRRRRWRCPASAVPAASRARSCSACRRSSWNGRTASPVARTPPALTYPRWSRPCSGARGHLPPGRLRRRRRGAGRASRHARRADRHLHACATGASAIQLGVEAIRRGEAEAALAIGADGTVQPEALIRFSLLSALSTRNDDPTRASRPFEKTRDGFVMSEGAACLVLESLAHARARGARVLGLLRGCGEKSDSFHRTRSNPDGGAIIRAMRNAIADAGLEPGAISYVNAHGTGTPENDKMETLGLRAVFGDAVPPASSNKSMIGHTLSAAGAIEAAVSLLAIRDGVLPPTINHDEPDPAITLDVVPNHSRNAKVAHVLSNSFGFGGQNVCLVISGEDA